MRVGKWGILHHWALGKLNSMGSWCTELSDYMGGWCRRKLNSMGGWCRRKLNSMGGWVKKKCLLPPPPPPPPPQVFFSGIALSRRNKNIENLQAYKVLTLNASFTTATDNNFCDIFHKFRKIIRHIPWELSASRQILIKYYALFIIFEKAAKFDIVVCCKL